mmetsp:Transcript_10089/g.13857  ORF Transcript_10089/g.13857 Transcript_10089/m.13857 type:complete len:110 (-) Transcript_10089:739-1068(-)
MKRYEKETALEPHTLGFLEKELPNCWVSLTRCGGHYLVALTASGVDDGGERGYDLLAAGALQQVRIPAGLYEDQSTHPSINQSVYPYIHISMYVHIYITSSQSVSQLIN